MKRSNIVLFTSLAAVVELIVLGVEFNDKFRFVNSTLELKYWLVCTIMYVGATILSVFHLVTHADDSERTKKQNYLEAFGTEYVSFLFTYHFLLFAVLCFYVSAWPWCIMGCIMFWVHNYVHRDNQNNYALEYAIEEAKIAARKPVILNSSDDLL